MRMDRSTKSEPAALKDKQHPVSYHSSFSMQPWSSYFIQWRELAQVCVWFVGIKWGRGSCFSWRNDNFCAYQCVSIFLSSFHHDSAHRSSRKASLLKCSITSIPMYPEHEIRLRSGTQIPGKADLPTGQEICELMPLGLAGGFGPPGNQALAGFEML